MLKVFLFINFIVIGDRWRRENFKDILIRRLFNICNVFGPNPCSQMVQLSCLVNSCYGRIFASGCEFCISCPSIWGYFHSQYKTITYRIAVHTFSVKQVLSYKFQIRSCTALATGKKFWTQNGGIYVVSCCKQLWCLMKCM